MTTMRTTKRELLAALKALVESPRPAIGSDESTWAERYRRYETAWNAASAIVRQESESAA